jgi:hypothetical protein
MPFVAKVVAAVAPPESEKSAVRHARAQAAAGHGDWLAMVV